MERATFFEALSLLQHDYSAKPDLYRQHLRNHRYFIETDTPAQPWVSITEIMRKTSASWPRQSGPVVGEALTMLAAAGYLVLSDGTAFKAAWNSYADCCRALGTAPSGGARKRPQDRTFCVAPGSASAPSVRVQDILAALAAYDSDGRPKGFHDARVWFVAHPHTGDAYPAKVIWGLATGQRGTDFTAHQARDALRRAGFEVADLSTDLPDSQPLTEGSVTQVTRDLRERNRVARQLCLAHYRQRMVGRLACIVCDLDFAEAYGPVGDGFIHVHHLDPLGDSAGCRRVDPAQDLVPVCPNCHAMIHRGGETRSIATLRAMLRRP